MVCFISYLNVRSIIPSLRLKNWVKEGPFRPILPVQQDTSTCSSCRGTGRCRWVIVWINGDFYLEFDGFRGALKGAAEVYGRRMTIHFINLDVSCFFFCKGSNFFVPIQGHTLEHICLIENALWWKGAKLNDLPAQGFPLLCWSLWR